MTNKEIANAFKNLAAIMELHGENPFKIRSYSNAYLAIRKIEKPVSEFYNEELTSIPGIGKAILSKIKELVDTGSLSIYQEYAQVTPPGIVDLLGIKGFGPKKIKTVWEGLGIETAGELLYACNENRLVELKGFGLKSQEDLRQKLEYFLSSKNKFHLASLLDFVPVVLDHLYERLPEAQIEITGDIRKLQNTVEAIEVLVDDFEGLEAIYDEDFVKEETEEEESVTVIFKDKIPIRFYFSDPEEFYYNLAMTTGGTMVDKISFTSRDAPSEAEVFEESGLPFVKPELRDLEQLVDLAEEELLKGSDILGVVHSHTTYSDGINSLKDLCNAAKEMGYQYIGITDHSKSAFYANGLSEDRLLEQMEAIDKLNFKYKDFKVLKGIESDILNDGSLDYEDTILEQLDFVIASVHSNLRMDEEKATSRLIKAVENPYTNILGHPSGRLLLSREAYPINYKKLIDACAANNVSIELNANPYRLDLDWKWIPYCVEKGVSISINPDAHSIDGIKHIRWGVLSASKAGLMKKDCINSLPVEGFLRAMEK